MNEVNLRIYRKIFPSFIDYLQKELSDCRSVLDLGCGKDSPIKHCTVPYSVGVELFPPYLKESKNNKIHDEYVLGDMRKIKFKENSFECVTAIDVLEHLTKEDGLLLIQKMETIASKKVLIFTPNGYIPQKEIDGNYSQIHRSGWKPETFKELGYAVRGINGIKFLRGDSACIRFKPIILFMVLSNISQKFTYHGYFLAFQLLCVKSL